MCVPLEEHVQSKGESNADNLSGRLFDIFLLHEQRKKCRYSCSHHPVLKRSVVSQEGVAVCNTHANIVKPESEGSVF